MKSLVHRIAAAVAVGALSFAGAPVALAQTPTGVETTPAPAPAAPAGVIDPSAQVSLTINKYIGEVGNTATPAPDSPQINFKIEKVSGVDLTTQDGWTTLAGLTAANAPIDSGFAAVTLPIVGGKATIDTATNSAFTVGVYKVTELNTAGYSTAAPFLVTLPYNGTDGTWQYNQTVNPKNQNVQPNKQADDSQATLGGNMTYTINAPVPAGEMDRFNIVDPMQAGLTLNAGSAVVTATGATPPTLAVGTDYTITDTGNTLRVDFTDAGITKLETARTTDPTLQVSVKFTAKVTSIPTTGQIVNTATIELPNGASVTTDVPVDTDPNTPDGPTSTNYGNLTITKTGGTATEMNGAQFQVYQCQPDAANAGKYQLLGTPLTVATTADGTATADTLTTANDTVQAFGLPASSFSGGATGTVTNQYCVLETKAPAGFVRDPEPRPVTYTAGTNAAGTFTVTVNNVKDSIIGQLPATGAWGIVILFLLGLLLLARGLYTSYKDNKAAV
ncbi:SpaH/EbpB family LPXTG-anchored major pilin [Staphylococcus chromogenes]|nr:SpaH/EbpB family LPXTG-anchored major pilin [Staphylococcus chromogenes]